MLTMKTICQQQDNQFLTNNNILNQATFSINGKLYSVKPDGVHITVTTTLNTFIRNVAQLKGTKMMCLEGGCGSCIVAAEFQHPVTKENIHCAVNSCLVTVLSCHGWKITTVEGIGNKKHGYDVTQKRLANFNGTQCGFCSPGMVMNMYSLLKTNSNITEKEVENSFGGNLCRCTGYRPIADAFKSLASDANPKLLIKCDDMEDMKICSKQICSRQQTCSMNTSYLYSEVNQIKWYKVFTLKEILNVLNTINDSKYMLVSGNTAHGVVRRDNDINVFIDITSVNELQELIIDDNLLIGANTTLTQAMNIFTKVADAKMEFIYLKELVKHIDLVANVPVRNIGTIAGNLALKHAHPRFQSDIFIVLETFGAKLKIVNKNGSIPKLVSPLEFLSLNMNGSIIVSIIFHPLIGNYVYQTYKIMSRAQNVHAIVNAGFLIELDSDVNTVKQAKIVYGAINTDFTHAIQTEQLLRDKKLFDDSTLQMVYKSLDQELVCDEAPPDPTPVTRKQLAISLFYKFILATAPNEIIINPKYKSGGMKFDRIVSNAKHIFETNKKTYPLTQPIPKLEALVQCSGEAKFVVDHDVTNANFLFAALILATEMPGSIIKSIDVDEAKKIPGVVGIYTAKDIPGRNMSNAPELNLKQQWEIFCSDTIKYNGQPIGIIVAETEDIANEASKFVKLNVTKPMKTDHLTYTVRDALKIKDNPRIQLNETHKSSKRGTNISQVIKGTFDVGSQYHYTMETQACVCVPIEDGLDVYLSTQWMDLPHIAISKCLNIPESHINVYVRRVGGAYGAKIFEPSQVACACALAANNLNRPIYLRVRMEENFITFGKRIPASADYEVGVDDNGKIQYLDIDFWANYGYTTNISGAHEVMPHILNCYDTSTWNVRKYEVKTDVPCHTYCRAPGSTEGIALIESIMDHIAIKVGKDSQSVRLINITNNDNSITSMIDDFSKISEKEKRIKQINQFNKENRWRKRGFGMVAMKYSLDYITNYQSTVSIYAGDGTVAISHGGIEMGQGINTKVCQVAAYVLGIDINMIQVKPSNTFVSPNNMITGGSFGSEVMCFATMKACQELLERMAPIKKQLGDKYTWLNMVQLSRGAEIDLKASYLLSKDRLAANNLKNYKIYGVTFAEIELDVLTGLVEIKRVDLLEDTGESMSPEVDIGQIEGAFIMGMGYWLMEHVEYDEHDGRMLNSRTWTYHPPGLKDIPIDWRIQFRTNSSNPTGVLRSKATGEPPLCMSSSIAFAIRHAIAQVRLDNDPNADPWYPIDGPTSTEAILLNTLQNYQNYKIH